MSDLTPFQTQNLVLLIGTNPLPNYVAAKLLMKPGAKAYFLHSRETHAVAQRLATCLELSRNAAEYLPVDDSDPADIFDKVSAFAANKTDVGLNYTGGTKVMSVHAYLAVQANNPRAKFSYLDARELSMIVQCDSICGEYPIRQSLSVPIKTLLAMHGYDYAVANSGSDPAQTEHLFGVAADLAQSNCQELRRWCDGNLRDKGELKKKDKDLKPVMLPKDETKIRAAMQWTDCVTLGDLARKWNMELKHVAEWLDGKWLELYALSTIKQLGADCRLQEPVANLKPPQRSFEFDVAVMRGYQLFAISYTTSNKAANIKNKLFEAYVRAKQMGGDEARIGILSCAPESDPDPRRQPNSIQKELEESWDATGKIRVFGAEHLPRLANHFRDWFNSQP